MIIQIWISCGNGRISKRLIPVNGPLEFIEGILLLRRQAVKALMAGAFELACAQIRAYPPYQLRIHYPASSKPATISSSDQPTVRISPQLSHCARSFPSAPLKKLFFCLDSRCPSAPFIISRKNYENRSSPFAPPAPSPFTFFLRSTFYVFTSHARVRRSLGEGGSRAQYPGSITPPLRSLHPASTDTPATSDSVRSVLDFRLRPPGFRAPEIEGSQAQSRSVKVSQG